MSKIIKNGQIVDDAWQILKLSEGETAESIALPEGPVLLPLAVWLAHRDEILASAGPFGVWIDSSEGPEAIAGDLAHLPLIGVNFPKFADGRGYSTARLLRERHGYTGELRAIGDVLRDQLFALRRCGFDAFALREDKDPLDALKAFEDFSDAYQASSDQPQPLFRRRQSA